MDQQAGEWFERCAHCDSPLGVNVFHPVFTERDEDGTVHLHSFCDETCMEIWID
ncbi:MAG: DUF7576 family protein, partial [Halodesulfurarchaeum sp.]